MVSAMKHSLRILGQSDWLHEVNKELNTVPFLALLTSNPPRPSEVNGLIIKNRPSASAWLINTFKNPSLWTRLQSKPELNHSTSH